MLDIARQPVLIEATALVADDEPLLRTHLIAQLARLWPNLKVIGEARNGRDAVALFDDLQPHVVFLDVQMPGMNGIEASRCMGRQTELVFVTAYDHYAVQAFRQGAIDYLLKPIDPAQLADTVQRLQARLALRRAAAQASTSSHAATPADSNNNTATLDQMAAHLRAQQPAQPYLKMIRASVGTAVRLIPVAQVAYLKSDTKYTLVAWDGGEALIRKTIRELADELDPQQFVQIHRASLVNLAHVSQFNSTGDAGEVLLKDRAERLTVSRSYVHLFRQM